MPTSDGQYHTDEFIGEVIGIAHLRRLHIDLPGVESRYVTVIVGMTDPNAGDEWVSFTSMREPTIGLALADVRQQIRERFGR